MDIHDLAITESPTLGVVRVSCQCGMTLLVSSHEEAARAADEHRDAHAWWQDGLWETK